MDTGKINQSRRGKAGNRNSDAAFETIFEIGDCFQEKLSVSFRKVLIYRSRVFGFRHRKIGHLYELKRSANRMACLPAGSVYPRSQTTPHSSTISLTQLAWYFWARTSVCSKEDTFIGAVSNKNPFIPRRTAQPSPSRSWPGTSGPAPPSAARRINL
jgi:hypothetical protein